MTDEDAIELVAVHEEIAPFLRQRDFANACIAVRRRRDEATAAARAEKASALSDLLATCLTMVSDNAGALDAAREAEALTPGRTAPKLTTARILLHFIGDPAGALAITSALVSQIDPTDPERYGFLSLHGTALARCGDIPGAVAVFREMTSPNRLQSLAAADYVGAYDLSVVSELVKAGAVREECRQYLQIVRRAPSVWPHLERQLEQLISATASPN